MPDRGDSAHYYRWLAAENVRRFEQKLRTCENPEERRVLEKLLEEERLKLYREGP